jgi:predicted regulator of Ras-like GTPase activity (Roadblock/LC7/MglB family)
MSACALAAAIHASAGELGKQLEGKPFHVLHHAGKVRQIFIAPAQTPRSLYIFLTVFDQESSLGLVTLYFGEFAEPSPVVLAENFERDLNRNLASLFGR